MSVAIITGSCGLIGFESASHFGSSGLEIVGIDNDMRATFFGSDASTRPNRERLERELGDAYVHQDLDIRDRDAIATLFDRYGSDISLVVHTAAQPSHDWAAREPFTDFDINAVGTLNMLEATRLHAPEAVFIFTSTNKVYGDTPNTLPLVEQDTRWEIEPGHIYEDGHRRVDVDRRVPPQLVRRVEGRRRRARAGVRPLLRHAHRLLPRRDADRAEPRRRRAARLPRLRRALRDDAHALHRLRLRRQAGARRDPLERPDRRVRRVLPRAAQRRGLQPRRRPLQQRLGARGDRSRAGRDRPRQIDWSYRDEARRGDHIWWISDNGRFAADYPEWSQAYDVRAIVEELVERNRDHWVPAAG